MISPPATPRPPVAGEWLSEPREPLRLRADIEGLRALAVALVVGYHADVPGFGGGFTGVDVFFVVSGFLITSLLVDELRATGRIGLLAFWGRRARRLLPASALVIVATIVASRLLLDPLTFTEAAKDAAAATLFSANMRFAGQDSYFTDNLLASPFLHFWSLGVEEQFYLVWPVALAMLAKVRSLAVTLICAAWTASFVACVQLTPTRSTEAFYWLPTRAWELLTGVLVAVTGAALGRDRRLARTALAVVALAAVLINATVDRPGFPGAWPLIPVLATAALIIAGGPDGTLGLGRLLGTPPMVWLGARSYGVYLWHFPLLVLAEARLGPLSGAERAGAVVASIGLAALSFRLVENPVRHHRWLRMPARSLALGGALIAVALGAVGIAAVSRPELGGERIAVEPQIQPLPSASSEVTAPVNSATLPPVDTTTSTTAPPTRAQRNAAVIDELADMAAANVATLEAGVATTDVPANLTPSLGASRSDTPAIYDNGCILDPGTASIKDCWYGDVASDTTVVLFGDSHAAQWFEPLQRVALDQGFRLVVMTKKRCPPSEMPTVEFSDECVRWRANAIARIGELDADAVLVSGYRYRAAGWTATMDPNEAWRIGITDTVTRLVAVADEVVLLGDSPTPKIDVPSCVAGNQRNVTTCVATRDEAVRPLRLAVEREVAAANDAWFVPTTDWACASTACPVIVGNTLMYRDDSHLTTAAALLLQPYLDVTLAAVLRP